MPYLFLVPCCTPHAAASAAIPQVVHGVLVDECEGKVYVAAREPGQVLVLDMAKGLQLHTTIDLAAAGGCIR